MGRRTFLARYYFIILLFMASLLVPINIVLGDGTGDYPPPENDDWVIANNTFISNETILLNGTLKIMDNATMTLNNVTLLFNSTTTGLNGIVIYKGSSAKIFDSVVTASSGFIVFRVYGNLTMEYSSISRTTGGIYLEYGDVTINNCTIFNNKEIAISGFGNPVVTNNTIYSSSTGISLSGGSAPYIYNNKIFSNEWGIICNVFSYATIILNNISGNSLGGISIELGEVDIHNNIISNNGGFGIWSDRAIINATNNSIFGNERWGIYSFQAPLASENNLFERDGIFNGEGDVIQEWEIIVHVFDKENNSVDNVNLKVYDKSGILVRNEDTIGNVERITLREFESKNNGSIILHNPFTIIARKGTSSNSSTLNIIGSEMSPIWLNNYYIYLDIEEEVPEKEYEFPVWGIMTVMGIWIFVSIMVIIGIITTLRYNSRRMK